MSALLKGIDQSARHAPAPGPVRRAARAEKPVRIRRGILSFPLSASPRRHGQPPLPPPFRSSAKRAVLALESLMHGIFCTEPGKTHFDELTERASPPSLFRQPVEAP